MSLSLAQIIAAKRQENLAKQEPQTGSLTAEIPSLVEDDSDCFLLSGSSFDDRNLRALLFLVHRAATKSNLWANDFERLRALATWLAPFPSSHLPYVEPIPRFLQSFQMWQLAAILQIPPAKLWPVLWEVMVEADSLNRSQKSFD